LSVTQPDNSLSVRSAAKRGWRQGQQWLRALAARNYVTAKALFQLRLWLAERRQGDPVLVYQMGKVGSTSVVRSLRAAGVKQPLYHIHDLNPATLASNEQLYRRKYDGEWQRPSHLWTSQYLLRRLAQPARRERPWKIITLTRDPVRRNLSAFFQTLELEFDRRLGQAASQPDGQLVAELSELFLTQVHWHDYPLTWFEAELKRVFEVDVYAAGFPQAQGYRRYQGPRAEVLVIKLELLDQCGPAALREFLKLEGFTCLPANRSVDKQYYPLYRQLVNSIRLPSSYLDRMYTSQYARHFYSEEELGRFRARWGSRSRLEAAPTGASRHD
jgi:hypothetical protein